MIGKIYKLECKITSKFYIGSTIHTLIYRLKKHRSTSKEENKMNSPLYTHFRNIGWDNATMILIKDAVFETRRDLLEIEKIEILKYLGQELCLNRNRPVTTVNEKKQMDKEQGKIRRQENKDHERDRVKQWRLDNPDKVKEQTKRYREKRLHNIEK